MKDAAILCVDDEEIVLKSLKRELNEAFGSTYSIETADGGEDALELFEELLNDHYEIPVVISDYIMPDIRGDEVLQRIHNMAPNTRTIMLTGQANTEGVTNAVNLANLYRYIGKPWERKDLILTVTEAIRSFIQDQELEKKHQELARLNQELKTYSRTLEQKVTERTQSLSVSLQKVESSNKQIMESMQFSKMIQRSLLPDPQQAKKYLTNSFFLWIPRDVVSGDMYYIDDCKDGVVMAVMDCTGHGIPGALMTMIASSSLRRIVRDDGCYQPGEILKRLNAIVKTSLHQDRNYALADVGLDAAICVAKPKDHTLIFAGARLPLYYVAHHTVSVVKGDWESLGYQRSNLQFAFTEHVIPLEPGMAIYLSTDGFLDQLGGADGHRFGTKQFKQLLLEHYEQPFHTQQEMLLHAFHEYKGNFRQQDDITIIGAGF